MSRPGSSSPRLPSCDHAPPTPLAACPGAPRRQMSGHGSPQEIFEHKVCVCACALERREGVRVRARVRRAGVFGRGTPTEPPLLLAECVTKTPLPPRQCATFPFLSSRRPLPSTGALVQDVCGRDRRGRGAFHALHPVQGDGARAPPQGRLQPHAPAPQGVSLGRLGLCLV